MCLFIAFVVYLFVITIAILACLIAQFNLLHTLRLLVWFSPNSQQLAPTVGQLEQFEASTMGSKSDIEGLSESNLELWKVKMEAILMFGMMDKTWSVVTRCLEDKKLMEMVKMVGLERRW